MHKCSFIVRVADCDDNLPGFINALGPRWPRTGVAETPNGFGNGWRWCTLQRKSDNFSADA